MLQQLLRERADDGGRDIKPYLISCLPSADAPATATIVDSFGPESLVDFTRCIFREDQRQPASSYIIRSEATGSRTLVNYNDLPEMTIGEFVAAADELGDDAWFHFEVRPTTRIGGFAGFAKPGEMLLSDVELTPSACIGTDT